MPAIDEYKSLRNSAAFIETYEQVMMGDYIYPSGSICKESPDHRLVLNMAHSPFTNFRARKLNVAYAKEEFLWYLRADKFDSSIEKHATTWAKIKQPDGSYFSNYGQYLFPNQFRFVIDELTRDSWSRRASMVLLKPEHLFAGNKDVVCTYAINFSIRNMALHMRVHMRSNDVIFGMTNDVFCFSMIYRMVYAILAEGTPLQPGYYTHLVDSMHVYQRHFAMIEELCADGVAGYTHLDAPWPTAKEAIAAAEQRGLYDHGDWTNWFLI